MQEKTILKTALICTIIGIAVLFLFLETVEPNQVMLNKLDQMDGKKALVTGIVVGVSNSGDVTRVKIEKTEMTTVTLFGDVPVLSEGDYVQIKGTVSKQDDGTGSGEAEMMGEEIRVI